MRSRFRGLSLKEMAVAGAKGNLRQFKALRAKSVSIGQNASKPLGDNLAEDTRDTRVGRGPKDDFERATVIETRSASLGAAQSPAAQG